jgi:ankyrin repeat protein
MVGDQSALMPFMRVIAAGDLTSASRMLAADPSLAIAQLDQGASRQVATDYFLAEILHYVYAGDTALHVAAASYRRELAHDLVSAGADVNARNRHGGQPLHYAADGAPGSANWNPDAQAATIASLIEAGADPNVTDGRGVTPLHRAVRTRCAAAVGALLDGGADPRLNNGNGSSPLQLATQNTGRGGTGDPPSKAQQQEIVRLLELRLATPPPK